MKESKNLIEMLNGDKVKVYAKIQNLREKIEKEEARIKKIDELIVRLQEEMEEDNG